MYEFTIMNKTTEEERIIFGYGYSDTMKKKNLNTTEWVLICKDYID